MRYAILRASTELGLKEGIHPYSVIGKLKKWVLLSGANCISNLMTESQKEKSRESHETEEESLTWSLPAGNKSFTVAYG